MHQNILQKESYSRKQDEKWKLITFLLRIIQVAKINYKIYNKKLLAIVEALTKWKQYLLDACHIPFQLYLS